MRVEANGRIVGEQTRLILAFRDQGYAFVRVSEAFRFDPKCRGLPADRAACLDSARRP